ncbi:MAG TPA: OmpA family protein [Polyangiales bacterium]|nr:OmpA family protein [Polyangiales bacterium]
MSTRLVVSALLLVAMAGSARAQVDTQRFQPHATSGGYFATEGSDVRHPVDPWSLGLWLSYAHNPLVVVEDGEVVAEIVSTQVAFDLTASYAVADWLEIGLHVPLAYLAGDDLSEAAIGDIRLLPKIRILNDAKHGVGLAFIADVRLPTHSSDFYGGARTPAVTPKLVIDHRFGLSGLRMALELGVLIREETQFRNISAGSEFQAGAGIAYRFDGGQSPVELMLDLRSAVGLAQTDAEEVGLEGLLGAAFHVHRDWTIHAGAGLGLLEGFGVPTARVLAGVRWEPSPNDPDHDGIASPDTPVEREGEAETEPAPAEGEEVPPSADDVDDAAREAAIRGGYDACPELPEDLDGDEDEDGCPEGDEDGDGVLDYLDRCSDQAETINGFEDEDGCPDEGPAQIIVEPGRIAILGTINFRPNSSTLDPGSNDILNQIALTLRKHREIEQIEIGGHTDITGPRSLNMRLSRDRARSVRVYLIGRGIPPARLSARGFGPDKPLADNETDEGRSKNRRVEFLVVH